ncbi:MAG: alpha/beta hydrolase [Candidatus Latescibacteria bacterium]|nr:alpha/beta hydrolase [Candidatus Latescibacterota bacterium]
MKNLRKYGKSPYSVAIVHGGPGAAGEMAPVAQELASGYGVLEPLQTASSLDGQVEELRNVLTSHAETPVTLIGFSWGAWLSYIITARFPEIVKKLILVSSGSFEERYAVNMNKTRINRLSKKEKTETDSLIDKMNDPAIEDKNDTFARFGELCSKADAYDPIKCDQEKFDCSYAIYQAVWKDASELRRSGKLLALGRKIYCPVIAIHGDFDSHPAEGVQKPLSDVLKNFRFILLTQCGHKPWGERLAKDIFYNLLKEELE